MEKINDIVMIPMHQIIPNRYQPRKIFDHSSIEELAQSIKQYGILQPITVRPFESSFELIMGERRFRAAQHIKLKSIPAIILDVEDEDSAVVALIENIQRVDLNYLEEAESYRQLLESYGLTQNELSEKVGKSQSAISNKLRLLKLSPTILESLYVNKLSERHARALLKLGDDHLQNKVLKHIVKKQLNVKDSEKYIDGVLNNYKKKHQQSTFKVNHSIYLNTIKKAYKVIQDMDSDVTMDTNDHEDHIEITIKIPKK
ncbi:MAG: nucleoid occlusion protein [Clostridia bacterium]|nr:nucleoid occlusion protein [Clostridia bacterium]